MILLGVLTLLSFFAQAAEFNNLLQETLNLLFGNGSVLVPFILSLTGFLLLKKFSWPPFRLNHLLGLVIFTASFLTLEHLFISPERGRDMAALGQGGGYLGLFLASALRHYISNWGSFVVVVFGFAVSYVVTFNMPWENIVLFATRLITSALTGLKKVSMPGLPSRLPVKAEKNSKDFVKEQLAAPPERLLLSSAVEKEIGLEIVPPPSGPVSLETKVLKGEKEKKVQSRLPLTETVWEYPPLSLLSDSIGQGADRGDVARNAQVIENALESFGVRAKVVEINRGPAVTQYALESAQGTKIVRIKSLHNDLALSLASPTGSVRIEAPIPGKSLIGIEVPNLSPEVVTLKSILSSPAMKNSASKLAVALGLDVSGQPVISDLGRLPHALVAGATGSGKSTMIHSFLASLLFRASPSEVKLILVDTKRVELTEYSGIPHLLTPVITDPEKVLAALKWALKEMDRRYRLFQSAKVRDLTGYNELSGFQAEPYIVIVVDELADMMSLAPVEVEKTICRLAQLSRATGIHLLLSTQRPDVRVITGLIKANIPCRIAFNTVSQIDSRVIIDQAGAEKLLGRGDMLYVPPEASKPRRLQGVYVSPAELKRLIDFLKQAPVEPDYLDEVTEFAAVSKEEIGEAADNLYAEAVKTVCQYERASASLLQRRLKVGYARAARLIDELEERGVVGSSEGSKARDVLIHDPAQVLGEEDSVVPPVPAPTPEPQS